MNLYQITCADRFHGYDSYDSFVIRAWNMCHCVEIAAANAADETAEAWTAADAEIELLASDVVGGFGLVLGSFNAG